MKTITLARKPLVGTVANNTLSHGCGGINIDASRIGNSTRTNASKSGKGNRDVLGPSSGGGGFTHGTETVVHNHGRWPANTILQHRAGCEQDGVKRVKGSFLNHECTDGDLYGKYASVRKRGHTDKDGKETVTNWICEQGCPVKALDEQSGVLTSGRILSTQYENGSANNRSMFAGDKAFTHKRYDYDSGGAARFFKQVKQ